MSHSYASLLPASLSLPLYASLVARRSHERPTYSSQSEVWDPLADPIGTTRFFLLFVIALILRQALIIEPHEQTSVLELCKTDNRLFNKLMITFASLVAEVQRLKRHVCTTSLHVMPTRKLTRRLRPFRLWRRSILPSCSLANSTASPPRATCSCK